MLTNDTPAFGLFQSLVGKVIGEGVRNAERQTFDQLMERRAFCLDYYRGEILEEDGGRDEYLKSFFQVYDGDAKKWETPNKLLLEHVDLTSQIINNKARNYTEQPVRKVTTKSGIVDAVEYTALLKKSGMFSILKQVEAYLQLLHDVAVGIFVDEDKKVLQPIIITQYYPVFDEDDPLQINPTGIIYPTARRGKDGEQLYRYWDAETTFYIDLLGKERIDEEPNTMGCFPFFFAHRSRPIDSHFSQPRTNLAEANRAVDVAMVGLNQSLLYNSFKALAIIGRVEGGLQELKLNKATVVNIVPEPETTASIEVLDLQADLSLQVQTLVSKIGLTAHMANVRFDYKLEVSDPQSGRAIEMSNFKDLEDRKGAVETLDEQVEQPLYNIVKVIAPKFGLGKVEQGELVCDFPEIKQEPSQTEKNALEKHELETFQISYLDLIMERNPDLDETEARELLEENVRINREVIGTQDPDNLAETIDKILKGIDTGTGEGDTETPGSAADPTGQDKVGFAGA